MYLMVSTELTVFGGDMLISFCLVNLFVIPYSQLLVLGMKGMVFVDGFSLHWTFNILTQHTSIIMYMNMKIMNTYHDVVYIPFLACLLPLVPVDTALRTRIGSSKNISNDNIRTILRIIFY